MIQTAEAPPRSGTIMRATSGWQENSNTALTKSAVE